MSRPLALLVLAASASFLARQYLRPSQPPPGPPAPPAETREPSSVFSETEIGRIRQSLIDPDSEVRWAAAQLLHNIRDPQLPLLLEKMMAEDPDPKLRARLTDLLKGREESARLGALVRGLQDFDKDVRIASLDALGEIGDPSVASWVTALLKDPETEVRVAALRTLGRFQDKRAAEFRALADKLKKDYDEALRRAAKRR